MPDHFQLTPPVDSSASGALLVEVPHAGLTIPSELADDYLAPAEAVMRDADIFVDRLYANAPMQGAALLTTDVSRYVVDLNRAPSDVDVVSVPDHPAPGPLQPRGVIWRATTDGRPILRRALTFAALEDRLARYYTPYHSALQQHVERSRERCGYAIVLAAHSMPSAGRSLHTDAGDRRADVVPGTLGRTTADPRVIDLVDAHFRDAGLSVLHDTPYRGGFTTGHYGQPKQGIHVIQVELNRALYVDESTFEIREPGFAELRVLLDSLVRKLGALTLG